MGIFELIKIMDKVCVIQKWYRKILAEKEEKKKFKNMTKHAMLVQKFVRKLLERVHQRKLMEMQ